MSAFPGSLRNAISAAWSVTPIPVCRKDPPIEVGRSASPVRLQRQSPLRTNAAQWNGGVRPARFGGAASPSLTGGGFSFRIRSCASRSASSRVIPFFAHKLS